LIAASRTGRQGGQRSLQPPGPCGQIERFLPGAGLLIQKTRVPAVPVLIRGAYEAWPATRSLPRLHSIRLRFGAPLLLADSEPETDDMDGPERIAARLHDAVAALGAPPGADPGTGPPKIERGERVPT
jgi:1-acyl-sn-glycerol-3-phosphate acyltransferase